MIKNAKGFSLVQVLIAMAALGGLALVTMQLMKTMSQGQRMGFLKAAEADLLSNIKMYMSHKNNCRISLAGEGPLGAPTSPVVFKKTDIDEDNEGLDIEIFLTDQTAQTRVLKKFSGTDPDPKVNTFDGLKITSLKLLMNTGVGTNYLESTAHEDIGQLRIVLEKTFSKETSRLVTHNIDLNVAMKTDNAGNTTILGCSLDGLNPLNDFMDTIKQIDQIDFVAHNCNTQVGVYEGTLYHCPAGKVISGGRQYHEAPNRGDVKCCEFAQNTAGITSFSFAVNNCTGMIYVHEGHEWNCPKGKFVTGIRQYAEGPNQGYMRCCDIVSTPTPVAGVDIYAGSCVSMIVGEGQNWNCPAGLFLAKGRMYHEGPNFGIFTCCKPRFLK